MDTQDSQTAQHGPPPSRKTARRLRVALWAVFLIAAVTVLVVALTREQEQTSEDNAAFSLDFPDGYTRAESFGKSFAIADSNGTTVILNPNPNEPPLSVEVARQRLHRLSCRAPTNVRKADRQTIITANAERPCKLFESTATVLGAEHRVTLFCSSPIRPRAAAACDETLERLEVK